MSRIRRVFGKALAVAAFALIVAVPLAAAASQPRDVIYNFTGGAEGGVPYGGLIRDAAGNFYGATSQGGGACNCGVVFKLSPLGAATALYTFTGGSDGGRPFTKLIADAAGNLYGTASQGGAHNSGVVFKLTPAGQETVLYSFAGGSDGAIPYDGLTVDGAGNIYGTTQNGGPANVGTVFKLAPDGAETVLHAFNGGRDGNYPMGVVMDKDGNLYGNSIGRPNKPTGRIFKIAPNGKFSVLYFFSGGTDGGFPRGGLIMDKQGVVFGATTNGGGACDCGVVFELGPGARQTVLHTFAGPDGSIPQGSLIIDNHGDLYGVTHFGGAFGEGTVFQLSLGGTLTVLHSFAGSQDSPPDGERPTGGLIRYMNKLYGTTNGGGSGVGCSGGCGVVFEVKKAK